MRQLLFVFIIIKLIDIGRHTVKKPVFYILKDSNIKDYPFSNVKSAFVIKNKLNWFLMYQLSDQYVKENNHFNYRNIFCLSFDRAKELLSHKKVSGVGYLGGF